MRNKGKLKIISFLVLLLLAVLMNGVSTTAFRGLIHTYTEYASLFVTIFAVFGGCLILAPMLSVPAYFGNRFWKAVLYILGGLASAGTALLSLYVLRFAMGKGFAVLLTVFVSSLFITTVFIINGAKNNDATVNNLIERGVKASTIQRKTVIKNAYAAFFENSGRIITAVTALYIICYKMTSEDLHMLYDVMPTLSVMYAMLVALALTGLLGNLIGMWIER